MSEQEQIIKRIKKNIKSIQSLKSKYNIEDVNCGLIIGHLIKENEQLESMLKRKKKK